MVTMTANGSRALRTPYWRSMRGRPVRRLQSGWHRGRALAVLLASCSSGPSSPSRRRRQGSRHTTTTVGRLCNHGHRPRPRPWPPVATSGPLTPGAPIALPFTAGAVTAAESPDGAVFVSPQDPTSPAPDGDAWVVDGNGPAQIAEHIVDRRGRLGRRRQQLLRGHLHQRLLLRPGQREPGRRSGTCPPSSSQQPPTTTWSSLAAAGGSVLRHHHPGQHGAASTGSTRPRRPRPISSSRRSSATVGTRRHHLLRERRPPPRRPAPRRHDHPGPVLVDKPNGLGGGVQYIDTVAGGVRLGVGAGGPGTRRGLHHLRRHLARPGGDVQRLGDRHRGRHRRRATGARTGRRRGTGLPAGVAVPDVVHLPHRPDGRHQPTPCPSVPPSRCSVPVRPSSRRTPTPTSSSSSACPEFASVTAALPRQQGALVVHGGATVGADHLARDVAAGVRSEIQHAVRDVGGQPDPAQRRVARHRGQHGFLQSPRPPSRRGRCSSAPSCWSARSPAPPSSPARPACRPPRPSTWSAAPRRPCRWRRARCPAREPGPPSTPC